MKKRTATLQTFTMIFIMICIMLFTLAGCGGQTSGTDGETTGMAMAMDNETLVYGSGENAVDVDGGVGRVEIGFEENDMI